MEFLPVLISSGVFLVALISFWLSMGTRLGQLEQKMKDADTSAAIAAAKSELLSSQFNEHKVQNGREISTLAQKVDNSISASSEAEKRLLRAIEDMGERFDKLSDRLDRFFSMSSHRSPH